MARRSPMTILGALHHVTQRGNRRERIFLEPGDEELCLDLMAEQLARRGVACGSYCLMPNHVHFILTPTNEKGLSRAVGVAHRRYAAFVGARGRWSGHLFQARFSSVAMDEEHLLPAFRYVALNPVKAGLVAAARDWPWSSVRAHIAGRDTPYVTVGPALSRIGDFAAFVDGRPADDPRWAYILKAEGIGRPVGAKAWIEDMEAKLGRALAPKKRGRKPRPVADQELADDLFGK